MIRKRKNKLKKQEDFVIGLPRWLLLSEKVSTTQKLFCMVLYSHRNYATKQCNPKIDTLKREIGLSETWVRTTAKELEKTGLITITPGTGFKKPAQYGLIWIDGSESEIKRLKEILISKTPSNLILGSRVPLSDRVTPQLSDRVTPQLSDRHNKRKETKEKKQQHRKPDVVSSLAEEKDLKPSHQELKDFGLVYINRVFVDNGWEGFDENARENVVCSAIEEAKKQTKNDLEDYLRYWKKDIDRKTARNKIGYLISMVGKGLEPPRGRQEITPPCLEGLENDGEIA